jgi:hypothetical protein
MQTRNDETNKTGDTRCRDKKEIKKRCSEYKTSI